MDFSQQCTNAAGQIYKGGGSVSNLDNKGSFFSRVF